MSKVTDELHRDLLSAAAILSVIGSGTKTMNPEYAGHLSGLFDRVRAALEAASSTPDGQAVAWRLDRLTDDGKPFSSSLRFYQEPESTTLKVTPLYAHPAPIKDGVTVKALEWQFEWHGEPGWCFVDTIVAQYRVSKRLNPDCFRMNSDGLSHSLYSDHATEQEAVAAAEADFRARILSALVPIPEVTK